MTITSHNDNSLMQKNNSGRILSIDALRSFTLFGILLAHSFTYFSVTPPQSFIDTRTLYYPFFDEVVIGHFFPIFNILFGCSFYLVLRNPNYPSSKFIVRCLVLCLFGIVVHQVYSADVLLRYGFSGTFLVLCRKFSNLKLLIWSLLLFIASLIIESFFRQHAPIDPIIESLGPEPTGFFQNIQWRINETFLNFIRSMGNYGIFMFFAYMLFGYWFARNFIEKIPSILTLRTFVLVILAFLFARFVIPYIFSNVFALYRFEIISLKVSKVIAALFYALLFLTIYYKTDKLYFWNYIVPYGKLSLTNYVGVDILGTVLCLYLYSRLELNFVVTMMCMMVFFLAQCLFSNLWLKNHKYGPLEWLLRDSTSRIYSSIKELILKFKGI